MGCLKELNPVWVREGSDLVEALSVEIFIKNMKIRCCVAYGPQENSTFEKKEAFWNYLDIEVMEAEKSGAGLILHFDGNLWAGSHIIPGDPKKQNINGKLFEDFLLRNPNLSVVNGLDKCEGLITRSRLKGNIFEESILDFFIVCSSVLPYVKKMVIDDKKQHILTNYHKVRKVGKAIDSDHFTQYMDLNLEFQKEKPARQEMLNFKDEKSQKLFQMLTSETTQFTDCFKGDNTLLEKIEKWRGILKSFCEKSFKKIRIKRSGTQQISAILKELINKRNQLMKRKNDLSKHKIKKHSMDKENKCTICDYKFSGWENDKKHLSRKHTVEGKVKCGNCGKESKHQDVSSEHIKSEHGILDALEKRINEINCLISDQQAKENRDKVMRQFSYFSENPEKIQMQKMWKSLKKVCPKLKPTLPSAKRNLKGKIISSQKDIKTLLEAEYKNRLRTRPVRNDENEIGKNEEKH